MSHSASSLRVKDTSQHFSNEETFMRYPYIAFGLVFLLFACEAPTSPRITPPFDPNVEEGGNPREVNPIEDPTACLKRRAPARRATAQSGFEAARIPCTTDPAKVRRHRGSGT
jgi:hypothetical protein